MTDHITTCVQCHADSTEIDGAYCSEECKRKNRQPKPKSHCQPSWYQQLRSAEVTGISVGEQ